MDLDAIRQQNNAAIERVQHASDDCTGWWRILYGPLGPTVECDRCGSLYPYDAGVSVAALNENVAGCRLIALAEQGARLLRAGCDDVRRDR